MSAYEALAASYDRLTQDVDYAAICTFVLQLLERHGRSSHEVLDLACGTGSLSLELAARGMQVIGADLSEEMLTEADVKAAQLPENRPRFICQPMQRLQLPHPVDLVVCSLDSLNYLTDPADCAETVSRVWDSLRPGGAFIFDINSEQKLRALDGQVFLDENEREYCVWRAEFDERERICYYGMDLFQRRGELWERSFEEHAEYAYSVPQLTGMLRSAGFNEIAVYADGRLCPPGEQEQRIYFFAGKGY